MQAHSPRDERPALVAICPLLMKSTYPKYLATSLLLLAFCAACAEGKGDPEATDRALGGAGGAGGAPVGAGGSDAGGTSQGGSGVAGASGSGASGASAGSSGDSGAGGAPVACDPFAPSACAHKCTVIGQGFFCDPEGTVAEGEACGADKVADNCGPGLLCVQGTCAHFCAAPADCTGDRTCSLVLDGPSPGSTFKVCQAKGNECDPAKQTGCSGTQACYPQTSGYKCDVPGSKAVGESCTFASDCVGGASCFKLGGATTCYKLCDLSASDGCEAGQKCSKQDDTYGICTN